MTRRECCSRVASWLALSATGLPLLLAASRDPRRPDREDPPRPRESLTALGRRYLEVVPQAESLARRMQAPVDLSRLNDRIDADLQQGDVVVLDGWVLARTEALACASLALRA